MPDTKISALTALAQADVDSAADLLAIVDSGASATKKITADALLFGMSGLVKDATDILALRRTTNAQTFRLYNTYTDGSNYEYGFMRWASNVLEIGAGYAGTGVSRALKIFTSGRSESYFLGDPDGYGVTYHSRYTEKHLLIGNSRVEIPAGYMLGFTSTQNSGYGPGIGAFAGRAGFTPRLDVSGRDLFIASGIGGPYAVATAQHNSRDVIIYLGYGVTPTDTGAGGRAGNLDIYLNSGGAQNGSGGSGADGAFRIYDDNTDTLRFKVGLAGDVHFGTHSAIGAETVTGYIEVKDVGGTTRKLAVVS